METETIQRFLESFNAISHSGQVGEIWYARDLQGLLGYKEWRNFLVSIDKAKMSCEGAKQDIHNHFVDVTKMVELGSGSVREVDDVMLSRYACYLIAQNGDSKKPEIAFAQTYFAVQTRKQEVLEQRLAEMERLDARKKLSEAEKQLSGVLYEHGVDDKGFAVVRSKGDQTLFGGRDTQAMKARLGVKDARPLADFLPTVLLKGKEFAAAITSFNVKKDHLHGLHKVATEHVSNNAAVRQTLLGRGIVPENLPAEEDIKKVERRLAKPHLSNKQAKKLEE